MKTLMAKPHLKKNWYIFDASGNTLGRFASKIAFLLQGKHKPLFTPHVDTGDYVVVINAEKIVVTGKKFKDKKYRHYTGYPGGLKITSFEELQNRLPTQIIEKAVKGMLPKSRLGHALLKKLKVYSGSSHPHTAQNPEIMSIDN